MLRLSGPKGPFTHDVVISFPTSEQSPIGRSQMSSRLMRIKEIGLRSSQLKTLMKRVHGP